MIHSLRETVTLKDGAKIPCFGYGCWRTNGEQTYNGVRFALDVGYRLIDTAARYENESDVGRAVKESGVSRESIFLVSKIWPSSFENPMYAIDESLRKLGVDYIDGFLMHWPGTNETLRYRAWEAMLNAREQKKLISVGVSNFQQSHLDDIIDKFGVTPAVNQIELHPRKMQKELTEHCKSLGMAVMAWGPIFHGHIDEVELIKQLSQKYGKSPAQITLRWHLQHEYIAIPKSSKQQRIAENASIFDFTISAQDMSAIDALDCGQGYANDPNKYDGADWVLN